MEITGKRGRATAESAGAAQNTTPPFPLHSPNKLKGHRTQRLLRAGSMRTGFRGLPQTVIILPEAPGGHLVLRNLRF
jgi:hypothetical protein